MVINCCIATRLGLSFRLVPTASIVCGLDRSVPHAALAGFRGPRAQMPETLAMPASRANAASGSDRGAHGGLGSFPTSSLRGEIRHPFLW